MDVPPDYCCAIIRLADGRFLCERRPLDAQHAPGRLTCFGGHRETGEEAIDCLLRELQEETGWQPKAVSCRHVITLHISAGSEAWFYLIDEEPPLVDLRPEPGFAIELVDEADLDEPHFSDWHRLVLKAWLRGESEVGL